MAAVLRIAVMPIVLQDANVLGDVTPEAVYGAAQQVLMHAIDVEPLPQEEIGPVLRDAFDYCASDLECLSARLRSQQIDLALEVIVNSRLDPALVTVQLINSAQAKSVANAVEEAPGRAAIAPIVERAVERVLISAGHKIGGAARIALVPADAELTIDPPPARRNASGFVGAPGVYRVKARREGFEEAAREVVIARGTDTAVELQLEEQGSALSSGWLWAGIGVAAVAAGVVTVLLLQNPERTLCQAPDPSFCR